MDSYPYTIASLRSKHPLLPEMVSGYDITREVVAQTAMDEMHLRHARAVASGLKALQQTGDHAVVTNELVEDAEARVNVIESMHAHARFVPQDMQATLNALNASMIALTQEVRLVRAESANSRIVIKNSRILGPEDLRPLQKIVPGPGFQLATAAAKGVGPVVEAYVMAMANNPEAAIGATPLPFYGLIEGYSHIFQNEEENFGHFCYISEFGFIEPFEQLRTELFRIAEDVTRTNYYMTYVDEVLRAIHEDKLPIKGLIAWAMLDNAEWNSGLTARFGIQHVNYTTLERMFKRSMLSLSEFFKPHLWDEEVDICGR
ncbi:hypothetical protein NLJ89_g9482 [Agrocybe chaxingu]|uniref:Uncharacterized protein n=1 Tax=Agrocybe chaxingu TaxID=84603 RepID=A0A9W8JSM2_9AGAR|nr:hypothetical protein NLJ89_g9482 [Agrocybe chaxingu]